jgi:hypothetical protein
MYMAFAFEDIYDTVYTVVMYVRRCIIYIYIYIYYYGSNEW